MSNEPALVHLITRPPHDPFIHPILLHQHRLKQLGPCKTHDPLKQTEIETFPSRFVTFNCGFQLLVVAGQDKPLGKLDCYPTGGFYGLSTLINHEHIEQLVIQLSVYVPPQCLICG